VGVGKELSGVYSPCEKKLRGGKNFADGNYSEPKELCIKSRINEGGANMTPRIPESLKWEHEELHAELARATKAGGKTGEAAKAVAGVLHNHFLKEEEFALPPIGLLAALARGEIEDEMRDVLVMTERLKAELPEMLREHQAVVTALAELTAAAKKEKLAEHARFAKKLMVHAQTEEEVLYPAAILIGEYLKLRLKA
jgi:hypothetical protein